VACRASRSISSMGDTNSCSPPSPSPAASANSGRRMASRTDADQLWTVPGSIGRPATLATTAIASSSLRRGIGRRCPSSTSTTMGRWTTSAKLLGQRRSNDRTSRTRSPARWTPTSSSPSTTRSRPRSASSRLCHHRSTSLTRFWLRFLASTNTGRGALRSWRARSIAARCNRSAPVDLPAPTSSEITRSGFVATSPLVSGMASSVASMPVSSAGMPTASSRRIIRSCDRRCSSSSRRATSPSSRPM
jgi:hypothetical protein